MRMDRSIRRGAALFVLLAEVPPAAAVQEPARPVIRVSAEAAIAAQPDEAQVEIGVVSQADSAAAAAAQNAQRLDAVLAELKRLVGPGGEVKTIGYAVTPNYRYPREGGKPTIVSYSVSNVVLARTPKLAEVGKLVDAATQSGANTVHRLQFTLRNDRAAQAAALKGAAESARSKAEAMAAALGVKIVRVVAAEESGAPVRPVVMERTFAVARADAPATPIEAGNVEVRASVTLTVEIAP